MEEISRGIYYENTYSGVTLGAILLPQGTILLDAPLRAEEGRAWRGKLTNLGASPNRFLINLDAHPDRTLGARVMDSTIIAHQKTAQVFRSRPSVFKGNNAESGSEWEAYDEAVGTRWAVPDLTFTKHMYIHWGPFPVVLEQHPGPMPGAIWVSLPEAKVIFVGDLVIENQPPFLANADLDPWIESLNALSTEYKNYTIISGRGGPVSPNAIKLQKKYLQNIKKHIEKSIKNIDEIEDLESIIPVILRDYDVPAHLEDQYVQRLRHGLAQYYIRHFDTFDDPDLDS